MRLKPTSMFLAFLGLQSFLFPSYAITVEALDAATVVVEDKSKAARKIALSQCARDVILKNSGIRSAYQLPSIQNFIQNPTRYLAKFSYQAAHDKLYLKCQFNLKQVQQTIQHEHLSVWGKQRPVTMLWMVAAKAIVNDGAISALRSQLQEESETRGLPLVLPIMDLQDVQTIRVRDLDHYFVPAIEQASDRYQGDFYAVGRLNSVGSSWVYEVRLYAKQKGPFSESQVVMRHSGHGETSEQAVSNVLEHINAYYVDRYGLAALNDASSHKIKFSGVQNLTDLRGIEVFLQTLSSVKAYKIVGYQNQAVTFDLTLNTSMQDLEKSLEMDPMIQVLESSSSYRPLNSETIIEDRVPIYSMRL